MSLLAKITLGLAVIAAVLFAALVVVTKTKLEPNGLTIFDAHFIGYTPEMARAYLAGISADAKNTYLGLFRTLDTLFPAVCAAAMMGALWLFSPGWPKAARYAVLLLPLAYLAYDYLENAVVAQILQTGITVEAEVVWAASAFTLYKWMTMAASLALVLLAWAARRFAKGRI